MIKELSIVILNWNGKKDTIRCLSSLSKSGFIDNITLIDNGSTDNSSDEIRKRYPYIALIKNEKNLGYSGGNNIGIKKALKEGSKYILLLNNDTIIPSGTIEAMISEANKHPEFAAINPTILDGNGKIWYAGGTMNYWTGQNRHLHLGESFKLKEKKGVVETRFVTGCCMLLRADAIAKVGLLDDRFFAYFEDLDLCERLISAGYKLGWVPGTLITHFVSRSLGARSTDYIYYLTRNNLLFMKKNAKFYHWITFIPVFIYLRVFRQSAGIIIRSKKYRMEKIIAIFSAILDFTRGSYGKKET